MKLFLRSLQKKFLSRAHTHTHRPRQSVAINITYHSLSVCTVVILYPGAILIRFSNISRENISLSYTKRRLWLRTKNPKIIQSKEIFLSFFASLYMHSQCHYCCCYFHLSPTFFFSFSWFFFLLVNEASDFLLKVMTIWSRLGASHKLSPLLLPFMKANLQYIRLVTKIS